MDKMKNLQVEAQAIRRSLAIIDPRTTRGQEALQSDDWLVSRGDRQLGVTRESKQYKEALLAATRLMLDVKQGRRPDYHLQEAMTTDDFPLLFGDLMYREMLGNYTPWPVTYPLWTQARTVKDFRTANLYTMDGGVGLLNKTGDGLDSIKEREPYPEVAFTEGRYQISVAKYGRRFGLSFEMLVNDDLNAFGDRPGRLAIGARRSEEYLATSLLVDSNGPHAAFFTAPHANIVEDNPPLSIDGLSSAYKLLGQAVDSEGQPIVIDVINLIVPPALEIAARNILNATEITVMTPGGGANPNGADISNRLKVANWMKGRLNLIVNPYIPYIATNANEVGDNCWFLVAGPNSADRPAFVFTKLRGYENPQLFRKDSNQRLLGGGDANPADGDFDHDGLDYKLRHIFGAAQIDPKMAVSSTGLGA